MKLIYHSENNGQFSPFDEAIIDIVKNEAIYIVCPYLGLEYLEKLNKLSPSWKLITDAEAWLLSCANSQRIKINEFIKKHQQKIHHISDLHAKVILSKHKGFIGSANFTEKGIFKRVEMSVLITENEKLEELKVWIDSLWMQSNIINLEELDIYVKSIPKQEYQKTSGNKITSTFKAINAKPKATFPKYEEKSIASLIFYLKFSPNRKWLEDYLDLIAILLKACELKNDDERLVISVAKGNFFLPVTINARYVLGIQRKPLKTIAIYGHDDALNQTDVKSLITKEPFSNGNRKIIELPPFCIRFNSSSDILDSELKKEHWLIAAKKEIGHGSKSPYTRYHNKLVYDLAINKEFRNMVLDKVFRAN